MLHAILIHGDESNWSKMSEADAKQAFVSFMAYNAELVRAGVLRSGAQLAPSRSSTTLRAPRGEVITTDGPFAETKEQLGGFYVIEVADLDAALAWAGKCPAVYGGAIEVRPVTTVPGA
jgi:hypothetical protein